MPPQSAGTDLTVQITEIATKLDQVIANQNAQDVRVEELYRTIRGHNGTPGLVTTVEVIRNAVLLGQSSASPRVDNSATPAPGQRDKWKEMPWWVTAVISPVIVTLLTFFLLNVVPHVLNVPVVTTPIP